MPRARTEPLPIRRRHVVLAMAFGLAQLLASCSTDLTGLLGETPAKPATLVAPPTPAIIPLPAEYQYEPGNFNVDGATVIRCDPHDAEALRIARYVSDLWHRTGGPALAVEPAVAPNVGAIVFHRLADPAATGKEGYRLDISANGVAISASDSAGLFYGGVSLWQLLTEVPAHSRSVTLRAIHIADAPRFRWRGLLLDSVRHFQSPEFVKSFIDAMALHKLNVLQWHLTDDQGWRLEIRKYPRLTSVGAWRVPAGAASLKDIDPKTGKPRLYGGFYTQREVRDIVRYAAERNVTIVPEIEMPGHAEAAIVAYPQLGSVADPPKEVSSDWGVFPYIYNVDDSTFTFLENVLTETMALFPSPYIHVGGDEAVKDQWKASPKIQAQMKQLGIANEDALQGYVTARIGKFLAAHGRKLIGWDEILEGGVPPDATITSWRGVAGGVTAAKSGHDAVMSPAPVLYLDNRQGISADEPPGRGHVTSLEDVYDFDPAPATLNDGERARIIGVQGNIWTEHIRPEDQVAYVAFPRAAALAEIAWSSAQEHDWRSFLIRLGPQMRRYRDLDLPFALSAFTPMMDANLEDDGDRAEISLSNQTQFGQIHYTLDGTGPTLTSPSEYPFEADLPSVLTAEDFFDGPVPRPILTRQLDSNLLRKRYSQELKLCTDNLALNLEDDAPIHGPRAVFLVDVMDPCWIYQKADMDGIAQIHAAVGQVPFNFQLGQDTAKIVLKRPETPDGELEIHLDSCDGPRIADFPLGPALANDAVTELSAPIAPLTGAHDLCFIFTRSKLDPMWAIDWIGLVPASAG